MRNYVCITVAAMIVACLFGTAGAKNFDSRAIDFYLKGLFLEARFDLVHAYSFYSYAARYAPDNGRITLRLALVTLKMGDLEKARLYATRLVEMDLFGTDAQMVLAEIDYKEGKYTAALDRLLKIAEREDVERFEVLKLLARTYLELERVGDARRVLEEANTLFSGDLFVHYRLGYIYMESGETEKAIRAFEKAIEISPGLANAHLALASLLRHAGRVEEAKRSYLSTLQLEPTNQTAFREYLDLLADVGDFEAGIDFLEPLYEEEKLEDSGEITLGQLYYRAGRVEDALRLFKHLVTRKGEHPILLRVVSDIDMELGHLRSSYTYLEKLIAAEPDTFSNYVALLMLTGGLAGDASGPHEELDVADGEVQRYFGMALRTMNRDSAEDNYLVGLLYRRHAFLDEAARFLLEAERLDPDERRTAMELASLFEDRGEYDEALKRIVSQYERSPDDASLMNFYGYLLAEKGTELGKAEELLQEALAREPENGYFMDSLGWIKFKQANYEQALELLLRAIELVGNDAVIWHHLGEAYRKLDRLDEAANAYRTSLGIDPDQDDVRGKIQRIEGRADSLEK